MHEENDAHRPTVDADGGALPTTVDADPAPPAHVEHQAIEAERAAGRRFLGQPGALASLFGVEMWERFSFYGMQGILLLYMYFQTREGGLGIDETVAAGIVGAYGGMVYVFCILGGWVADRLLGSERTMYVSALLIMAGHVALALVPGVPGLVVGLLCVAIGSGGLKANIANLVGSLYTREDPRRDAGFSIFYMGVNIGGLFGPLLTGWAQKAWGFHVGFGLAAVGMAIGLAMYTRSRRHLPPYVRDVPNPLPRAAVGRTVAIGVGGLALVLVLVLTGVINPGNLAGIVVALSAVSAIGLFAVILRSPKVDAQERSRVWAFIPLFVGSAAFFALFQQQFTVITIYSDHRLNRMIGGWEMPISWAQSFNPFFIILFAPVMAALWTRLGRRNPSTPVKFGIGIALMGAAFLLFLPMAGVGSVPVMWVALIMLVATLGELMVSPVGLSLSTKLAPRAYPVLMVALYNLSIALGTALSGSLAGFYSQDSEVPYFGILGAVTIGIGLVILAAAKPIHRGMRGID